MMALIEGILVAAIWASSFVFVKMGLMYMGPLTMAGLRYTLAALLLTPWLVRKRAEIASLPRLMWLRMALLGLCAFTISNGAFNTGLKFISPTTMTFLMSFSPLLVYLAALVWLKEIPSLRQKIGLVITLAGSALFFSGGLDTGTATGLVIGLVGVAAFSAFGVMSREVARQGQVSTLLLTGLPLVFGGASLLAIGLPVEGLPHMTPAAWGLVAWLAAVNTTVGLLLYNHALKKLTALEMNVLLNLEPLITALWAWLLLGDKLSVIEGIGMLVAVTGVVLVQQGRK